MNPGTTTNGTGSREASCDMSTIDAVAEPPTLVNEDESLLARSRLPVVPTIINDQFGERGDAEVVSPGRPLDKTLQSREADQGSESDDDSAKVAELERQFMARLDDEITAQEEVEFLQRMDEEITAQEEIDFVNRLRIDIEIAEEQERIKERKRPFAIIQFDDPESFDYFLPKKGGSGKKRKLEPVKAVGPILEVVAATFLKLVPRVCHGKKIIGHDDMVDLIGFHPCFRTSHAKLSPVKGDPNSWWLTMYTGSACKEECMEQLSKWIRRKISLFNSSIMDDAVFDAHHDAMSKPSLPEMYSPYDKPVPSRDLGGNASINQQRSAQQLSRGEATISTRDVQRPPCMSTGAFETRQASRGRDTRDKPSRSIQLSRGNEDGECYDGSMLTAGLDLSTDNKRDSQNPFLYFRKKYLLVAKIEFSNVGIKPTVATSSMWNLHKKHFGKSCSDRCTCAYSMEDLTRNVVKDQEKRNRKLNHQLDPETDKDPAGFVNYFCPRFRFYLRQEYPNDLPEQFLNRLYAMWRIHERTGIFGVSCGERCECLSGWESVFKKGSICRETERSNSKRDAEILQTKCDPKIVKKPIPSAQGQHSQNDRPSRGPNNDEPERAEYVVAFDASQPMGLYFVNEIENGNTLCKVKSVCPNPSRQQSDDRIQQGTTVLAVLTKEGHRIPICRFEILKERYQLTKASKKPLRVVFINNQNPEENFERSQFKKVHLHHEQWNKLGKWKGSYKADGWPGGATFAGQGAKPTRGKPVVAASPRNDVQPNVSSPRKAEKGSSNSPTEALEGPAWQKISTLRRLVYLQPISIMRQNPATPSTQARKQKSCQFNTNDEERMFHSDSPSNEFYIVSSPPGTSESPETFRDDLDQLHIEDKQLEGTAEGVHSPPANDNTLEGNVVDQLPIERIQYAVDNDNFIQVLALFESGAADHITAQSLQSLRDSIAEKARADRDFRKKDILLKLFRDAWRVAHCVRHLKDWVGFKVFLEKFQLPAVMQSDTNLDDLALKLHSGAYCGRPDDITEIRIIDVPKTGMHLTTLHYNFTMESRRILTVKLEKKSQAKAIVDRADILLQDIYAKQEKSLPRPSTLLPHGGEVTLRFERCDGAAEKKAHRKKLCTELSDIIERIAGLNDSIMKEGQSQGILSYEVPIWRSTLLQSAVMMVEKPLVERLLNLGAKVTNGALAAVDLKDGWDNERKEIGKLLQNRRYHRAPLKNVSSKDTNNPLENVSSKGTTHPVAADAPRAINDGPPQLGGFILELSRDWLFHRPRCGRHKVRCTNWEGGFCRFGETCHYAHVYEYGGRRPQATYRFEKDLMEIQSRKDQNGNSWYTSGYIDKNNFFYPGGCVDGDGVLCEATGVWWYGRKASAIQAIDDAVTGIQRISYD